MKFYVVMEIEDWEGGPVDLACWAEHAMNANEKDGSPSVDVTVYDNIDDLLQDNVLDAMAGN